MHSETWFVRYEQEMFGPISLSELKELARRSAIPASTAVSPDSQTWITAGEVESIAFAPPAPPNTPRRPGLLRRPKWLLGWTAGLVSMGLLNLILICGLYGILIEALGLTEPEPNPSGSLSALLTIGRPKPNQDDGIATTFESGPPRAALSVRGSLAPDELVAMFRRLPEDMQAAWVQEVEKAGKDFYAIRIHIRNVGRDPVDVDPGYVRVRCNETDVFVWDQAAIRSLSLETEPFLQRTRLLPGESVSGLIGLTPDQPVAAALARGEGAVLYTDFKVSVTYE